MKTKTVRKYLQRLFLYSAVLGTLNASAQENATKAGVSQTNEAAAQNKKEGRALLVEANGYFRAKEYDRAQALYERILLMPAPPPETTAANVCPPTRFSR